MTTEQTDDLAGSICMGGVLRWPAELADEMRPILAALAARSLADEGCVEYRWTADLDQPGAFHFFEIWVDERCLNAHLAADYEADFMRDHASRVIQASAHRYEVRSRTRMASDL